MSTTSCPALIKSALMDAPFAPLPRTAIFSNFAPQESNLDIHLRRVPTSRPFSLRKRGGGTDEGWRFITLYPVQELPVAHRVS